MIRNTEVVNKNKMLILKKPDGQHWFALRTATDNVFLINDIEIRGTILGIANTYEEILDIIKNIE